MALSDWKQIETFDDAVVSHSRLANEVCNLCYHISQVIAASVSPYWNSYHSEFSDEIIKIVYDQRVSQYYTMTRPHIIEVTYRPKEVIVFKSEFELVDRLAGSIRYPSDQKTNLFRVGSWIDHLATLAPRVNEIHNNYDVWKQERERQQKEASNKQLYGRLD